MASEEVPVNDTIANMIANLKPKLKTNLTTADVSIESPLKRSLSSSGFFDYVTPPKRARVETSFEYISSPSDARRLRADLVEARNNIMSLENRIKHMHSVRKEMQIMFETEVRGLEQQKNQDRKAVEELEAQVQKVRKRELELKGELAEAHSKLDKLKLTTDQKIEELEKSLAELKNKTTIEEEMKHDEYVSLRQRVEELQVVLEAAQEDAEAHKKLSAELEKRLSQKNAVERDLERKDQALQKARMELKELEFVRENYYEYQQQIKTHQQKLANFSDLEKENQHLKEETARLKDAVRNKLLLEEEVYDLKSRLVNYKEQEKKFAALQAQQVQTEMQLNEWHAVARGICESTGMDSNLPHLLRGAVERLQQQEINLTSEKVQLESQLNNSVHDAKVARSELEKNQKHMKELETSLQQRQSLIHRMQKKLLLVGRERDSYRMQLDSYERDLTVCINPGQGQANALQSQHDRIENLERIVEGYRDMVTKLENDLQSSTGTTEAVPVRVEQLARLQAEIDKLKTDNDLLRNQRDNLEIRLEQILVGNDTNTGGRIVHPVKNPLSEFVAERDNNVEKLQEEVQRLKRKVRNLEEGLETSKLNESALANPKEVQALKEQLKSSENQVQRLKEYFKISMQEFRNVIYMLLGYKVDKSSTNSQYKLTSMYAEHQEDQICFQLNSEGALNLLENDFSSSLEDLVDLHLRHQKSIPVFLSAITMDLFNNRTMTKTYEIDDD